MDYSQFCETINKVFTQKGIEKDPLFVVPKVESTATLAARRKYLVNDNFVFININKRFSGYFLCFIELVIKLTIKNSNSISQILNWVKIN